MRKLLLGTTALAAAATLTANAALADVSISGAFEWAYNSRSSNIAASDGTTFGTDSSITIGFTNKTDSGLTLGYTQAIDTDGATLGNNENSLSIGGGFGSIILGHNDAAADAYIQDESDLIAEDQGPVQASATIGTSSSMALGQGDNNKITYHLPAMGGLTAGVSHTDSGETGATDSTSMGAKYSLSAAGAAITLSYATSTTDNATKDIDSSTMGMKIVSGDISMIISQGKYEASGADYDNMGASISYKMSDVMTIGAYTFDSENDLSAGEEYSRSGAEVQYTIASGLTAVLNVDDYDYKKGANTLTVNDSGTNSRLTIKASF